MDETLRPLTAHEREILERLRTSRPAGGARFAAFLAFLVSLGLFLILSPASWQIGVRSLAPVAAALVVAVVVFTRMRARERRSDWTDRLARDLAGGVARVSTYRVEDAIQVEEFEDEGSSWYLKLDDGRVAFLTGQYLYEVEESGAFPSAVVSVTRAPESAIVFEVRCEGTSLSASGRTPHFTTSDYDQGRVPEDGALVAVEWESLRRSATAGPA